MSAARQSIRIVTRNPLEELTMENSSKLLSPNLPIPPTEKVEHILELLMEGTTRSLTKDLNMNEEKKIVLRKLSNFWT